jgi:hypothetical protein
MPAFIDRAQQNTSEELDEFSNTGPFGGIQSEVPKSQVEQFGFTDCLNVVLRKSRAETRPGVVTLNALPAPSNEDIVGFADFYTNTATRIQTAMTLTRLLQWNSTTQAFVNVPPAVTALLGGATDLFTWAVVNNILCFCQGVNNLQGWNGITGTFDALSANAFPAKYLMELGTHLVTAYTIEAAVPHTQRVRWSGSGDPTDWVSPSSGLNDILGDLGPITGAVKIFQSGYIFHQWGITQMVPTGIGTNPFSFVPLTTRARGNTIPYSLAAAGEEFACYVGKDNVYKFNGTNSEPIGDRPIQGGKRVGARSAIFNDLRQVDPKTVEGYVSDTIYGNVYSAYWLVIPTISIWVYNLEEENWTRFAVLGTVSTIGRFFRNQAAPRWLDLVGTWAVQTQAWNQFASTNPFDAVILGMNNGVLNLLDFTIASELNWAIKGLFVMGDPRHAKTIQKFRVSIFDNGPVTFNVSLSNQLGVTVSETVTMGTGSGNSISQVLALRINGIRINWQISGNSGQQIFLDEFAPLFKTAQEQRGGTVDA